MTLLKHHLRVRQYALGVFVVLIVVILSLPVLGAKIILRAQATPSSTVVRLGDVAQIEAADSRESKRLAAVPLMPAPIPGTQRFLRTREIQDLLAAHGENLRRHTFQGELSVAVLPCESSNSRHRVESSGGNVLRRAAWLGERAEIDPTPLGEAKAEQVRTQVTRLISEHLNRSTGRDSEWQIDFTLSDTTLRSLVLGGNALECSGGKSPWVGKQRFILSCPNTGREGRVVVFAEVALRQTVAVAIRPIERGAILTAADVELVAGQNALPATGRHIPLESVDAIIGMEATRSIPTGDVIYNDCVQPEVLVRRGEEISVIARGGGIQVRTVARARQNGARGEPVQVESFDTHERFDAVVTGLREAVVLGGSATPVSEIAERPFRTPRR